MDGKRWVSVPKQPLIERPFTGIWLADDEKVTWLFNTEGDVSGYMITIGEPIRKVGPRETKHANT
jgi:hypothetical protein